MPSAKKTGNKKQDRPKQPELHWKEEPEEHDFPAALSYLSLLLDERRAAAVVKVFRTGPVAHYKAKDLLRASNLPLLPEDNAHVALDLDKVRQHQKLSPVLLVRGSLEP